MTDNFEKDINVPSKEIIGKFSDGYCIVLENNEISIRENVFTKLQIVFGKRTNELLEFVKELYLDKKVRERESEKYKQALDEIKEIAIHNNLLVRAPFCGPGYRDLSGQILHIINKTKVD